MVGSANDVKAPNKFGVPGVQVAPVIVIEVWLPHATWEPERKIGTAKFFAAKWYLLYIESAYSKSLF